MLQADTPATPDLSPDQETAWATIAGRLAAHGIDLEAGEAETAGEDPDAAEVLAVTGKAGSGKTVLLAGLARRLREARVNPVLAEDAYRRRRDHRSFTVLAPTNKAVSVLRSRGVPASTLH
ncbi:MAG: AAA family ATPase, partial [Pseudomonadota bacterium]